MRRRARRVRKCRGSTYARFFDDEVFKSLDMQAQAPEAISLSIRNRRGEGYSVHDALPYLGKTPRVANAIAGKTNDAGVRVATERLRQIDPESTVTFERPVTLAEIYAAGGE